MKFIEMIGLFFELISSLYASNAKKCHFFLGFCSFLVMDPQFFVQLRSSVSEEDPDKTSLPRIRHRRKIL